MSILKKDLIKINKEKNEIICCGEWDLTSLNQLKKTLKKLSCFKTNNLVFNGQAITKMDSAAAWLFSHWLKKIKHQGITVALEQFSNPHLKLLSLIEQKTKNLKVPKPRSLFWVTRFGKSIVEKIRNLFAFFSFIGHLTFETLRVFFRPVRLRWNAIVSVIYKSGFQALPIIALLSFMIGVVIAYQMGLQLRKFGANIFVVDLLGLAILREFGPLLTAIMVAGRSGSAFTAQLGIMKLNQEIDALDTMGVTPAELLLLPRIVGLFFALPLLTVWADIFGVVGGMIMTHNMFEIQWLDFLTRFQREVPLKALIIGLGKAPIFALIIATIGCFQGMQVKGSAESVGTLTTRSVVLSIFFIILADAAFSVLFSEFQL